MSALSGTVCELWSFSSSWSCPRSPSSFACSRYQCRPAVLSVILAWRVPKSCLHSNSWACFGPSSGPQRPVSDPRRSALHPPSPARWRASSVRPGPPQNRESRIRSGRRYSPRFSNDGRRMCVVCSSARAPVFSAWQMPSRVLLRRRQVWNQPALPHNIEPTGS